MVVHFEFGGTAHSSLLPTLFDGAGSGCLARCAQECRLAARVCVSLSVSLSLIKILKRGKFYIWQRCPLACIKCAQHFYVNILLIAVLGNKAVFIFIFFLRLCPISSINLIPTADALGFGSRCHHSPAKAQPNFGLHLENILVRSIIGQRCEYLRSD